MKTPLQGALALLLSACLPATAARPAAEVERRVVLAPGERRTVEFLALLVAASLDRLGVVRR